MSCNIVIAGVGGQGVVLASRLLGMAAVRCGLHVTTAETIGMAQRGGSVISHVRIGKEVYGPLIPAGVADLIIGLEPGEAARNLKFLSNRGNIIINTRAIIPPSLTKDSNYNPEETVSFLKENCPDIISADFTALAKQAGNPKAANVAMLAAAAAAGFLPFSPDNLWKTIKDEIPEKYIQVNKKAFDLALETVRGAKK